MRATLLLGDFARVVDGKLDILGAGWTVTGPHPATMGLGVLIDVPWDLTDQRHELRVWLSDQDGHQVTAHGGEGPEPVEVRNDFEVGRAPELAPGRPVSFALAVNINGLPLPPGQRFQWRLELNGQGEEAWNVSFETRAVTPAAGSATGW
jgi:hypothetical protein